MTGGPDDSRDRVHHRADDPGERGPLHDMTRTVTSIEDLRVFAERRVPRMFYDYADSGSWTEGTYRANSTDFATIKLRQRVAVDMTDRTLASTMVGQPVAMPVALAPTGLPGCSTRMARSL